MAGVSASVALKFIADLAITLLGRGQLHLDTHPMAPQHEIDPAVRAADAVHKLLGADVTEQGHEQRPDEMLELLLSPPRGRFKAEGCSEVSRGVQQPRSEIDEQFQGLASIAADQHVADGVGLLLDRFRQLCKELSGGACNRLKPLEGRALNTLRRDAGTEVGAWISEKPGRKDISHPCVVAGEAGHPEGG